MALTPDEARMLLAKMDGGQPDDGGQMSPEIAQRLLSQMGGAPKQPPSPAGMTPELPTQGAAEGQGVMPYIAALLSGGKRGFGELGSGAAGMAAQGVDKLTGSQLQGQVPQYQLSGIDKAIAQAHPTTAGIGEFAAKAAPMFVAPEFGGGLAGQMAGQAAVGGLEGAIESPEDRLKGLLTGTAAGAAGPVIGKGVGYAAGVGKKATKSALSTLLGGAASHGNVQRNIKALKDVEAEGLMPIGPVIESPHAKSIEALNAMIPGSGQAKDMQKVGQKIEDAIESTLNKMAPKGKESITKASKGYIDDVKKGLKKERDIANKNYSAVDKKASEIGIAVDKSSIHESASKVIDEIKGSDLEKDSPLRRILSKATKAETSQIFGTRIQREATFNDVIDLRKDINKALRDLPADDDNQKRRLLMSLKSSVDGAMQSSAEASGNQEFINLFNKANEHYKEEVVPLNSKEISKFTRGQEDADKFIPTFLKTGQYDRENLLNKIAKHLSEKNKESFAHRYLTKSAREVAGEDQHSKEKILREYMKLTDSTKKSLISNKNREMLDSAYMTLKMGGGDLNQMVNPKTGAMVQKALAMAASGLSAGALPAGGNVLRRIMRSKTLKNTALNALKTGDTKSLEKLGIDLGDLQKLIAPLGMMLMNQEKN